MSAFDLYPPLAPGASTRVGSSFPAAQQALTRRRVVVRITETRVWVCPAGVTEVHVLLQGGGGGGAGTTSTTQGAGGGGGGALVHGPVRVVPGTAYTITIGASGAGGVGAANGTDGGTSSLIGTGLWMRALGGKGGLTTGAGVTANGTTQTSVFGHKELAGSTGGAGGNALDGSPGGATDLVPASLGGAVSGGRGGGGGGGSSAFALGAVGGDGFAAGAAGSQGSGGSGAGANASTLNGGPGGAGFAVLTYDE